jgi:WD40 repeat protein
MMKGGILSRLTNPQHHQVERWSINDVDFGTDYDENGKDGDDEGGRGKRSPKECNICEWILNGHESPVLCVIIFGELFISGSEDGKIKGWSITKRNCHFTILAHTEAVTSLVASPEGKFFVSSSLDKKVKGWNLENFQPLFQLEGHLEGVCSVIISHQKNKIIVISGSVDRTIKGWDVTHPTSSSSSTCLFTFQGHTEKINALVLLSDENIASTSDDSTVKVWNIKTQECLFTLFGHQCGVSSVSSSDHGKYLISGSDDQTVKVWCVATRACIFTFHDDKWVTCVAVYGDFLISGSEDCTVKVWSLITRERIFTLRGHTSKITHLAIDKQYLVSTSADMTLRIWTLGNHENFSTLIGHNGGVTCVTSITHHLLASGGEDQTIKLWNPLSQICLKTLIGHQSRVTCLTHSSDHESLVSGSDDHTVKLWEIHSQTCRLTFTGHTGGVTSVSMTPNLQYIVSGSEDHTVKIWSVGAGAWMYTLRHEAIVTCVKVSQEGQSLTSSSSDGIVKIWSLTGECSRIFQSHQGGVSCVAWMREDAYLVTGGSDHSVKVWSLLTSECIATLIGHQKQVTSISATCDGEYLVSGSEDQTMRVWGIHTHECLLTYRGHHQNMITDVGLVGNGEHEHTRANTHEYLISASGDSTIQIFPFSFQRSESLAFKSLEWLITLFRSHQGSSVTFETILTLCPSYLDDVFTSDDGKRTTTFLCRAIELEAPDRMIQELFKISKTTSAWTNLFHSSTYGCAGLTTSPQDGEGQNILETLMQSKRERALEVVLDQIVYGYDQHNQVRMGLLPLSQASWRITPLITSSAKFTSFTSRLIKEYPQLAQNFLSKLGVVKTFSEVDARNNDEWHTSRPERVITLNGTLPDDCGFVVVGYPRLIPKAPIDTRTMCVDQIFHEFWDENSFNLNPLVS